MEKEEEEEEEGWGEGTEINFQIESQQALVSLSLEIADLLQVKSMLVMSLLHCFLFAEVSMHFFVLFRRIVHEETFLYPKFKKRWMSMSHNEVDEKYVTYHKGVCIKTRCFFLLCVKR